MAPNNSFKPNLLRYTNNVAEKACHVVASATQVGLTQALGSSGVCEKQLRVAFWLNLPFCVSAVMPRELAISAMRVSGLHVSLHCRVGHAHHATAARHSPGRPIGAQVAR